MLSSLEIFGSPTLTIEFDGFWRDISLQKFEAVLVLESFFVDFLLKNPGVGFGSLQKPLTENFRESLGVPCVLPGI